MYLSIVPRIGNNGLHLITNNVKINTLTRVVNHPYNFVVTPGTTYYRCG